MQKEIFRKKAVERLSSPEQLDQAIQIIGIKNWITLLAFGLIIISVILWSVFGSIPIKIKGSGIIIKSGGIFDITSTAGGQIIDISIKVGDIIKKGQVIGIIAQPQINEQMKLAQNEFNEKKQKYEDAQKKGISDELKLRLSSIEKSRESIQESIKSSLKKTEYLLDRINSQEELLKQGLITKQMLMQTKSELDAVKDKINTQESETKRLNAEEAELKKSGKDYIEQKKKEFDEINIKLKSLIDNLDLSAKIISPYSGKIVELKINAGDLAAAGSSIANIELSGEDKNFLEAVIFVSSGEGKKAKTGMQIRISPYTVKREEYGFMLGAVKTVSNYPATFGGIMKLLNNENLVRGIMQNGAPIEIHSRLIQDEKTPSGFKWTSLNGPDEEIQSGTICDAEIIIEEKKPISLVIPLIKKKLDI